MRLTDGVSWVENLDDDFFSLRLRKTALWVTLAVVIAAAFIVQTTLLVWPTQIPLHEKIGAVFASIQAAATFLAAAAIVAAFSQVRQGKIQLRDSRRWNQMNFALNYFATHPISAWEDTLEKSFVKLIGRDKPLTDQEAADIYKPGNETIAMAMKFFMNTLETYCVAINMNVAHDEVAKRIYGHKFVQHFIELERYIRYTRQREKSNGLFCEFEAVCRRWRGEFDAAGEMY